MSARAPSEEELFAEAIAPATRGEQKACTADELAGDQVIAGFRSVIVTTTRHHTTQIRARGKAKPNFKDILGGVVDSGEINAWALGYRDNYFIGMTWGVPLMVQEVFQRLASYKTFMPWVGEAAKESPPSATDAPPLTRDATHLRTMYSQDAIVTYPAGRERWHLAHTLASLTYRAILFHEIGHITLGHLDYLYAGTGRLIMSELGPGTPDADKAMIRQAFETDADALAMVNLLSYFFGDGTSAPDLGRHEALVRDSRDALFVALLCMDTLFKILGEKIPPDSDWTKKEHPPTFVRRVLAQNAAKGFLHFIGQGELVKELDQGDLIHAVLDVSERLTSSFFGEIGGVEVFRAYSDKGQKHERNLNDISARIKTDRERVAPVG